MTTEITSRKIVARAPTRIDLAGGTLDIWPLYLFLKNAMTINLGIDLFAETELIETRHQKKDHAQVHLISGDQSNRAHLRWEDLDTFSAPPSLELHLKFLKYFKSKKEETGTWDPQSSLSLKTSAQSPAGAGLGGSSALSISMIGALASWAKSPIDSHQSVNPLSEGENLIAVARDIETTVIQVPAGLQDYYGAMFGGLQSIHWLPATHRRFGLDPKIVEELNHRILLFYSGHSRNSGINNWALYKNFIDGQSTTRQQFYQIAEATQLLESALIARDWQRAGCAIDQEWKVRNTLSAGISTPEISRAFEIAIKNGASAGKICGAGGGGCFFIYLTEPHTDLREKLLSLIGSIEGIRHLPFSAQKQGLHIEVCNQQVAGG